MMAAASGVACLLYGSFKSSDAARKRRKVPAKCEDNLEAMVSKSIRDNFKQFGPTEIDGTAIGNVTLR